MVWSSSSGTHARTADVVVNAVRLDYLALHSAILAGERKRVGAYDLEEETWNSRHRPPLLPDFGAWPTVPTLGQQFGGRALSHYEHDSGSGRRPVRTTLF